MLSSIDKLEKLLAWVVGLALAVAGPLEAARNVLPASVGTGMVLALPVLIGIERYLTNSTTSPNQPPLPPSQPPVVTPTVIVKETSAPIVVPPTTAPITPEVKQ